MTIRQSRSQKEYNHLWRNYASRVSAEEGAQYVQAADDLAEAREM